MRDRFSTTCLTVDKWFAEEGRLQTTKTINSLVKSFELNLPNLCRPSEYLEGLRYQVQVA
mgnify:CR=1 FL=1